MECIFPPMKREAGANPAQARCCEFRKEPAPREPLRGRIPLGKAAEVLERARRPAYGGEMQRGLEDRASA